MQSQAFAFTLHSQKPTAQGPARAGTIHTPHGDVPTPVYMAVGTQASVKALDNRDLLEANCPIILGNTYHLYLRPGMKNMVERGGMHTFMGWNGPILTDSGGFQVFSLGAQMATKSGASQVKITDEGVVFTSFLDGSKHLFTPEKAIEIQQQIGADIIMAFDECTPDGATHAVAEKALQRTRDWAERCVRAWEAQGRQSAYGKYQALFGIIQGARHREWRERAAREITSMAFDGIALGGETIGYEMEGTAEVMGWVEGLLPKDKPRYAMGLGLNPQDIITAVRLGFDMFDCVAPTRIARTGSIYSGHLEVEGDKWWFESEYANGRLSLSRAEMAHDDRVLSPGCDCTTCQAGYTRSYLHHLMKVKELSYYRLASIHNVRVMVRLCEDLRRVIMN
jgi:queuine tRNA-ribosyltransferase